MSWIAEGAVLGAELTVAFVPPKIEDKQTKAVAAALQKRLDALRNGDVLTNMYVGGENSYMRIQEKILNSNCVGGNGKTDMCLLKGSTAVTGSKYRTENGSEEVVRSQRKRLKRYEELTMYDEWNCSKQLYEYAFARHVFDDSAGYHGDLCYEVDGNEQTQVLGANFDCGEEMAKYARDNPISY